MTQAPNQTQAADPAAAAGQPAAAERRITIPDAVVIKDLADMLNVAAVEIIKELMKNGVMATINQSVDFDTAAVVATDVGFVPEEEGAGEPVVEPSTEPEEQPVFTSMRVIEEGEDLEPRAPVVTVLGHVDHGKTTLLDTIRHTSVVDGEAGGITQHIGAYRASAPDGRPMTFIDTPGHAAFSEMRARGAQVTDVAIIIVAADDGVMPQTREAIDHVRAAGVPMVVSINKIDVSNANVDRVKQQLMEVGLVPEEFGGDTVVVPVSALSGDGVDDLLESVQLVSDLQDLRADPHREAVGVVLEGSTDPRRGVTATVLVQTGTLRVGDVIIAGLASGRVKAMTDEDGNRIKEAGPSTPVTVLGLSEVPAAGERVRTAKDERSARAETTEARRALESEGERVVGVTLDTLFGAIHKGTVKDLNIVLKTDVQGSIEPLVRGLEALSIDEVNVKVIHAAAGTVNESDVNLAAASSGVILAFNTRPELGARKLADIEHVEVRQYRVIYDMVDDMERAVQGLLEPIFEERQDALVEVREVFRRGRRASIAGSFVRDGVVHRDSLVRVMRGGEKIHESRISSLKRFKDDIREARNGMECGIQVAGFEDFEQGDELICYHMEQVR